MLTSNYTFLYLKNYLYSKPVKGLLGCGVGYCFSFNGIERDNEIKGDGNMYATEFRELDTRLITWWSIDPLFAKYPSHSPYNYTEGNPIVYNDRTGKEKTSTIVDMKGNVVGGKLDGDKGVYMVSNVTKENFDQKKIEDYKKVGARIGTSASEFSFVDEGGQFKGHVNLGSNEAANNIDYATSMLRKAHSPLFLNISAFLDYKSKGGNAFVDENNVYDIKAWGLTKGFNKQDYNKNAYEASWGPQGLIFTNRDAGNYFAGKAAAMMGIPWSFAHSGFGAFNANNNSPGGVYKKTFINFMTFPFREDGLKYKEFKASDDLQQMGYFSN
jgi:RHS repeat-associated protein